MLKRVIPNKGSYCYNPHDQTNTVLRSIDLEVGVHRGKSDFVAPGPPGARNICASRQEARPKDWEPE